MMATVLDGRQEARRLLRDLQKKVRRRKQPITLASILVGRRFDSQLYVRLKTAAAKKVGIKTVHWMLPATVTTRQLTTLITILNSDRAINGILLQLPLPSRLPTGKIVRTISPRKDVDGFHPQNRRVVPPTIAAVLHLITLAKPQAKSRAVLIARDSVFAQRLKKVLRVEGYRVTVFSQSHGWKTVTRGTDIIVTARGQGRRLLAADVRPGAIVIDVGIRKQRGQTIGDVDPSVWKVAKAVSPVPGGVGPLTIAYLLYNTYHLALTSRP